MLMPRVSVSARYTTTGSHRNSSTRRAAACRRQVRAQTARSTISPSGVLSANVAGKYQAKPLSERWPSRNDGRASECLKKRKKP